MAALTRQFPYNGRCNPLLATVLGVWWFARRVSMSIARVIEGLSSGAEQVSSTSEQVSPASQSLVEGSPEQAAQMKAFVEDLVVLVQGAGSKAMRPASPSRKRRGSGEEDTPSRRTAASGGGNLPVQTRKEVRPEHILPLEEGEFKDW